MASKAPSAAPMPKIPSSRPSGGNPAAVGLIALLVGLVGGYGAGRATLGAPTNPLAAVKGSYQDGYEAAHKKLLASGLLPQVLTEVHSLAGKVKSVGTDSLVVTVDYRSADPLDESNVPAERTVTVGKDTKISVLVQKDQDQFMKELKAFQDANQKGPSGTLPPQITTEKAASLSDLQPGDEVVVGSDANILTAATFTATAISKSPTLPAGQVPGAPLSAPPGAPPAPKP